MSPSLRWWSLGWWPLVHLRSFRCRLLDGSHYTRPTYVVQVKPIQTTPKPLQTLAFVGVSQPHDGNTNHDTTATPRPRPGRDGRHGHDVRDVTPQPRPRRPGHDGHDGHDVQGTTQPRPRRGHDRIQRNVPARYHTTRQNTIIQTFQCCTMQQTTPVGECPPGAKSKAAGSLVLTLNARWNIFGLPVTHEGFTYLVVATVVAPYILCIMFLGLMLMAVKLA